jgi:hypothetical protein
MNTLINTQNPQQAELVELVGTALGMPKAIKTP